MKIEKIGMRTIKSGIAVVICVIAANYMVQNPMYSAVACIISMQDTVKGSVKAGMNRIKGTIMGGIIGFLLVSIKAGNPIICGIGSMITIYLCNILNLNNAITVSSVTFISIYLSIIDTNPASYSFYRVLDTSVGVIIAVLINYFLARPNYLNVLNNELRRLEKTTIDTLRNKIIKKGKLNTIRLDKDIKKIESIHKKLLDELDYSRDEIDEKSIEEIIGICKEIYFHMQSIEFLEKKLYLNQENYDNLKVLLKVDKISWDINEEESPVFNYHLNKVINEINTLKSSNRLNKQ